ncbi:MAG: D-hydroxyproline dehydrogenase subunit alpha [Bryobacterales bacterium]|nr:D-hydroxyproline dehydrogenase subunit alpha [Bryobacterales bacterium]
MIVVVGAGPAGIAAALRAQECGARVTVVDDNPAPGGQIWRGDSNVWLTRFRASGIPFIASARVITGDAQAQTLLVETPEGARKLTWDKLIIAAGSRELFLPFPGWTLPGVFGAGGLQALAKSGLSVADKTVVIGGTGPLLLAVAAYLRQHGAHVKLIAEQASPAGLAGFAKELLRNPNKLLQGVALARHIAGSPYVTNCWIESATGQGRLEAVTLRQGRRTWTERCDFAAIGYGLVPDNELATFLMNSPNVVIAGTGELNLAILEGEIAGFTVAGYPERALGLYGKREKAHRFATALQHTFALRHELKSLPRPDTIVCRCEDVTFGLLCEFPNSRAAKLHTRCGMGPCQGRICGPAAEFLFGWNPGSLRPPLFPAKIGSLMPATTE